MYSIRIKKPAVKFLESVQPKVRRGIEEAIEELRMSPKRIELKMRGFENRYRLAKGSFRIIYEVEDDVLTVTVIDIGSRGDIYKAGRG